MANPRQSRVDRPFVRYPVKPVPLLGRIHRAKISATVSLPKVVCHLEVILALLDMLSNTVPANVFVGEVRSKGTSMVEYLQMGLLQNHNGRNDFSNRSRIPPPRRHFLALWIYESSRQYSLSLALAVLGGHIPGNRKVPGSSQRLANC